MMIAENEARGRSNRAKGDWFMRKCAAALELLGWKGAEIIHRWGRADITGVGDLLVECKNERGWDHLSEWAEKAAGEAKRRGFYVSEKWPLPMFVIWKRRWGWPDPMSGWCILPATQWWALWEEVQRLETKEAEFAAWKAGLAAAAQAREAAG